MTGKKQETHQKRKKENKCTTYHILVDHKVIVLIHCTLLLELMQSSSSDNNVWSIASQTNTVSPATTSISRISALSMDRKPHRRLNAAIAERETTLKCWNPTFSNQGESLRFSSLSKIVAIIWGNK